MCNLNLKFYFGLSEDYVVTEVLFDAIDQRRCGCVVENKYMRETRRRD